MRPEDPVHQPLECCRGPVHSKRHHGVLVQALGGGECRLRLRALRQRHLPISFGEVQSGDEAGGAQPLYHLIRAGHGVRVEAGHLVQLPEIVAEPEAAVRLRHDHYGARPRAMGLLDDSQSQHFLHFLLDGPPPGLGDPVRPLPYDPPRISDDVMA